LSSASSSSSEKLGIDPISSSSDIVQLPAALARQAAWLLLLALAGCRRPAAGTPLA
jgi:3-deoxy-D-manno-octulosonic acid (KDO) 8-phosphate synthase